MALNAAVAAAAMTQAGVLNRRQLAELGISRWNIRDQVRAGRWRLVGRQVVVLDRGPWSTERREWIALLELGQRSALCGPSAAARWGLTGFEPSRVHVVVARGGRVRSFDWLHVHESRRYDAVRDRHPVRTPPVVRAERAVLDMAVWTRQARTACAIVATAVRQRITTADRLQAELEEAGAVRHRLLLQSVLADVGGGSQALSEIDFVRLCRAARLPTPRRQQIRVEPNGRRRYVDAEFLLGDGRRLIVEVDGAVHLDPPIASDDLTRQNEFTIAGDLVMRFSSIAIRTEPTLVIDQLRRMLAAHSDRLAA